ncbi:MAG TPA: hypothetical protein VN783_12360 [Thermoanaerobaculia bacterium]|nr:hypothetical protein [Thermoanaerobaculia bacterium]
MATRPDLSEIADHAVASLFGDHRESFTILDRIAVPGTFETLACDTVVRAEWRDPFAGRGSLFALLRVREGSVLWTTSWRVAPSAFGPARYRAYTGHLAGVEGPWGNDGFLVALGLTHRTARENHLAVVRIEADGRLRWVKVYDPVDRGRRSQALACGIAGFDDGPLVPGEPRPESTFLVHGSGGLLFQITGDGSLAGAQRRYKGAGSAFGSQLRRTRDGFYAIGQTLGPETRGWILHLRAVDDPVWERAYVSPSPEEPCWFDIAEGTESLIAIGGSVYGGRERDSLIAFLEPANGPEGLGSAGRVRSAGTIPEAGDPVRFRASTAAAAPLRSVEIVDQPLPMLSERVEMVIEDWAALPGPETVPQAIQ